MTEKLRSDRHTRSLLTDHMVFSPKYRGKVLVGRVRELAEEEIREICRQMGLRIIRMSVSSDHVHIFYRYQPKHSVSYIANMIKGRSSRVLRERFPELKEWSERALWAPSCFHGSVGHGMEIVERYISNQRDYAVRRRRAGWRRAARHGNGEGMERRKR